MSGKASNIKHLAIGRYAEMNGLVCCCPQILEKWHRQVMQQMLTFNQGPKFEQPKPESELGSVFIEQSEFGKVTGKPKHGGFCDARRSRKLRDAKCCVIGGKGVEYQTDLAEYRGCGNRSRL